MPDAQDLDEQIWTKSQLIDLLGHETADVRLWALERLRDLGMTEGIEEHLVSLLEDSDSRVVRSTLDILEQDEKDLPEDVLWSCVNREELSWSARVEALGVLAASGNEEAQEHLLDGVEQRPDYPIPVSTWVRHDLEGFLEALHERWGDSGLPLSATFLRALVRLRRPDLAPAIVNAMEQLDEDNSLDVFREAVEEGTGRRFHELEPNGIREARIPGEPDVEEEFYVAVPDLEDELAKTGKQLRTAAENENWEKCARIALEEIPKLNEWVDESVAETGDFAWGTALARTLQRKPPDGIDEFTFATGAYQLLCEMLITILVERTLQENDGLQSLLDLWTVVTGDDYRRVCERIRERWREAMDDPERKAEAEQLIDSWLDEASASAYASQLWFANSLPDFSVDEKARKLCEKLETGEHEDAWSAMDFVQEYLRLHPGLLRQKAPEMLAGPDGIRSAALEALASQNRKWASRAIIESLDELLNKGEDRYVWSCLYDLGDPAALDRAVEEWRPKEPDLTDCVALLARLDGSFEDLPDKMKAEVAEYEKRVQEWTQESPDTETMEEALEDLAAGSLRLRLRCTDCGRTYTYEVERAFLDPEILEDEERDNEEAVVPAKVIRCKNCGAEDCYEFTNEAIMHLTAQLMVATEMDDIEDMSVVPTIPQLSDGTRIKSASEAIGIMRARAEKNPESGEAWRRLGNTLGRFEESEEAVKAWRKALEVDEHEVPSAYQLAAHLWDPQKQTDAPYYVIEGLERLPQSDLDDHAREVMAHELVDMLHAIAPRCRPPLALVATWRRGRQRDRAVIDFSGVDLRRVERWDRLADMLADDKFVAIEFTDELPDSSPTRLEHLINSGDRSSVPDPDMPGPAVSGGGGQQVLRSGEKVGRNDPCPCGSEKKYKHCCGKPGKR